MFTPLEHWLRHAASEHFSTNGTSFKSATRLRPVQIAADEHDPALPRITSFPTTDRVAIGNHVHRLQSKARIHIRQLNNVFRAQRSYLFSISNVVIQSLKRSASTGASKVKLTEVMASG
jgi:hypothetical protein